MEELDADLVAFIRAIFRSLWMLDTLFLLMKANPASRSRAELVRELRATTPLVNNCVEQLLRAGLVTSDGDDVRFAPANPRLEELAGKLEEVFAVRPLAVMRVVTHQEPSGIQSFADAFKIRESKE